MEADRQATVERGVRVSIFTRPENAQSREAWRRRLKELREIVPRVVAYSNMHQKIVVVDDRTTLLGSLNTLSHRNTREVMVEHEGPWFATSSCSMSTPNISSTRQTVMSARRQPSCAGLHPTSSMPLLGPGAVAIEDVGGRRMQRLLRSSLDGVSETAVAAGGEWDERDLALGLGGAAAGQGVPDVRAGAAGGERVRRAGAGRGV